MNTVITASVICSLAVSPCSQGIYLVETREDEEQNVKLTEILELLVAAGYFRARIKGLSPFDKVVGGMTWCITTCNFDVDVDLLFQENSTIGQKIALSEKIVSVLPRMKCPHQLEPHQIQGMDFIHIFPVVQWLVKRAIETKEEMGDYIRSYSISQFQKTYSLPEDDDFIKRKEKAIRTVVDLSDAYKPRRKYKRQQGAEELLDEESRIHATLLEYGRRWGYFSESDKTYSPEKWFTYSPCLEGRILPPGCQALLAGRHKCSLNEQRTESIVIMSTQKHMSTQIPHRPTLVSIQHLSILCRPENRQVYFTYSLAPRTEGLGNKRIPGVQGHFKEWETLERPSGRSPHTTRQLFTYSPKQLCEEGTYSCFSDQRIFEASPLIQPQETLISREGTSEDKKTALSTGLLTAEKADTHEEEERSQLTFPPGVLSLCHLGDKSHNSAKPKAKFCVLLYPGIEPGSPSLQADSLPTKLSGKPNRIQSILYFNLLPRKANGNLYLHFYKLHFFFFLVTLSPKYFPCFYQYRGMFDHLGDLNSVHVFAHIQTLQTVPLQRHHLFQQAKPLLTRLTLQFYVTYKHFELGGDKKRKDQVIQRGADCGSDHELFIAKFRLKLKKLGKTSRPFKYDLNQIPYDYTVEVK
ncbi:hypothetical protein FD755_007297 [Muntiacus reevesi]|uniref:Coiled-coil domain-containing protein 93 n=1 Tax=Muntiacus reevesi TaxID=9886 RepID=A0A5J5MH29_MUNRE|nr:hypothetical protein FD755_007297 [Muntiacus reevesi]